MENNNYNNMMKRLCGLVRKCEDTVACVKCKEDLEQLPLQSVIKMTETARSLLGEMDIIANTELYHILGMGDLTPMQELAFIDVIKQFLKYRPYVKSIASFVIPKVPTIPDTTGYKCKVLGVNLQCNL